MLITVEHCSGQIGMVKDFELEELIRSNKIKKFLRAEGWVMVGSDQIREKDENYQGRERRQGNSKRK